MPKHAHGRTPALAFDLVLTRRAASLQRNHVQVLAMAMYTGQRACQATRTMSQVPQTAAWPTWPPRPLRHMDGGCAHARLPPFTLTNILVRLQCGDRTRAIAIRATTTSTLEVRGCGVHEGRNNRSVKGFESSQAIRSVSLSGYPRIITIARVC